MQCLRISQKGSGCLRPTWTSIITHFCLFRWWLPRTLRSEFPRCLGVWGGVRKSGGTSGASLNLPATPNAQWYRSRRNGMLGFFLQEGEIKSQSITKFKLFLISFVQSLCHVDQRHIQPDLVSTARAISSRYNSGLLRMFLFRRGFQGAEASKKGKPRGMTSQYESPAGQLRGPDIPS